MTHFPKYSDHEADLLFNLLNNAPPEEVIQKLRFLLDDTCNSAVFEYDSDLNHAWYLLGLAYEKKGQMEKAAFYFRKAIESYPTDADSYVAYSNTEDDLQAQVEMLTHGLKYFDDDRVRFNLANALLDLKRPKEALLYLESIQPDFSKFSDVIDAKQIAVSLIAKGLGPVDV